MSKLLLTMIALLPGLALGAALPVEKIAPGIYVHHGEHKDIDADYGGDICNISFVIGSKGVAVIDTGGSPVVGARLRQAIREVTALPNCLSSIRMCIPIMHWAMRHSNRTIPSLSGTANWVQPWRNAAEFICKISASG